MSRLSSVRTLGVLLSGVKSQPLLAHKDEVGRGGVLGDPMELRESLEMLRVGGDGGGDSGIGWMRFCVCGSGSASREDY
jgi:hypothetical protein